MRVWLHNKSKTLTTIESHWNAHAFEFLLLAIFGLQLHCVRVLLTDFASIWFYCVLSHKQITDAYITCNACTCNTSKKFWSKFNSKANQVKIKKKKRILCVTNFICEKNSKETLNATRIVNKTFMNWTYQKNLWMCFFQIKYQKKANIPNINFDRIEWF